MSQVQISVSVDDAHLPEIEKIAQELRSAGVNVEQILSTIGVISGSIEPKLMKVESLSFYSTGFILYIYRYINSIVAEQKLIILK